MSHTDTILVNSAYVTRAPRIGLVFGSAYQLIYFLAIWILINLSYYLIWGVHSGSYSFSLPIFSLIGGLPAIYRSRPMQILLNVQNEPIIKAELRQKIESLNYSLTGKTNQKEIYPLNSLPSFLLFPEQNIILESNEDQIMIVSPAYIFKKIECWFQTRNLHFGV